MAAWRDLSGPLPVTCYGPLRYVCMVAMAGMENEFYRWVSYNMPGLQPHSLAVAGGENEFLFLSLVEDLKTS